MQLRRDTSMYLNELLSSSTYHLCTEPLRPEHTHLAVMVPLVGLAAVVAVELVLAESVLASLLQGTALAYSPHSRQDHVHGTNRRLDSEAQSVYHQAKV